MTRPFRTLTNRRVFPLAPGPVKAITLTLAGLWVGRRPTADGQVVVGLYRAPGGRYYCWYAATGWEIGQELTQEHYDTYRLLPDAT